MKEEDRSTNLRHTKTTPFCIYVIVFFSLIAGTTAVDNDAQYRLVRDLLKPYDKRVRPALNFSESLNVTFGVALAQIIDVDEKNQIITTNCWLNQGWIDPKLRWEPKKYGNITVVRIPFKEIWLPDIVLYNTAEVTSPDFTSVSTNVIVTHDGNVTWLSMVIFKSSCSIDVQYFPFDEQNCSMSFSSWTYDAYQVNILNVGTEGDISNYMNSTEWNLVKFVQERQVVVFSCCPEPYIFITYYIAIKRRPLFYLFNMVMPCILISMVALLGFYMPSDSGEKISMGITTLLSMTVFLMMVVEQMPPSSDDLPIVGMSVHISSMAYEVVIFSCCPQPYIFINYYILIKRRPLFYMFNLVVPCLLISLVSLLGFYMPSDSGEKISMGITTLLSLTVFLMIVADMLPPTSDVLPLIGLYYGITIVVVSSATAMTVLTLNIHHKGQRGQEIPSIVRTIFFDVVAKILFIKVDSKAEAPERGMQPIPQTDYYMKYESEKLTENGGLSPRFTRKVPTASGTPSHTDNTERQFMRVLQKVYQTIEKNEMRLADQDRRDHIKYEWQQLALILDRVLLIVFLMVTTCVTLGIFLPSPHSTAFGASY